MQHREHVFSGKPFQHGNLVDRSNSRICTLNKQHSWLHRPLVAVSAQCPANTVHVQLLTLGPRYACWPLHSHLVGKRARCGINDAATKRTKVSGKRPHRVCGQVGTSAVAVALHTPTAAQHCWLNCRQQFCEAHDFGCVYTAHICRPLHRPFFGSCQKCACANSVLVDKRLIDAIVVLHPASKREAQHHVGAWANGQVHIRTGCSACCTGVDHNYLCTIPFCLGQNRHKVGVACAGVTTPHHHKFRMLNVLWVARQHFAKHSFPRFRFCAGTNRLLNFRAAKPLEQVRHYSFFIDTRR